MRTHKLVDSPMGQLTLVASDGVLAGLYMELHARRPAPYAFGIADDGGFAQIEEELAQYFAGQRTVFTVPIALTGTAFQQQIWELLRTIPYGRTRTYSQLAAAVGGAKAIRAVGAANARNPISIVVPCHRVLGSDGSLTGYAGGLARKRFLLDLEAPVPKLF